MNKIDLIIQIIKPYYLLHPGGGNLHVVLDDGNMDTLSIKLSLENCIELGDKDGEKICRELLKLKRRQREELFLEHPLYMIITS